MAEPLSLPPILLVRLRSQLPNGVLVGESRRVCHLVPLPATGEVPVLRAYCGTLIGPGSADLLDGMTGMPCEACLARARIPALPAVRAVPITPGHREAGGWAGFPPHTRLLARFVLLVLLQHSDRPVTAGQVATMLGQDARTVHLVLLIFAAIDWIQPTSDDAETGWADRAYRLTEQGPDLARGMLARGLTATFVDLATALGLDTIVIAGPAALDPGGCSGSPDAVPTGHDPHPDTPPGDHGDPGETP